MTNLKMEGEYVEEIFTRGALMSIFDFLLMHLSQLLTYESVSDVIPSQKNIP